MNKQTKSQKSTLFQQVWRTKSEKIKASKKAIKKKAQEKNKSSAKRPIP